MTSPARSLASVNPFDPFVDTDNNNNGRAPVHTNGTNDETGFGFARDAPVSPSMIDREDDGAFDAVVDGAFLQPGGDIVSGARDERSGVGVPSVRVARGASAQMPSPPPEGDDAKKGGEASDDENAEEAFEANDRAAGWVAKAMDGGARGALRAKTAASSVEEEDATVAAFQRFLGEGSDGGGWRELSLSDVRGPPDDGEARRPAEACECVPVQYSTPLTSPRHARAAAEPEAPTPRRTSPPARPREEEYVVCRCSREVASRAPPRDDASSIQLASAASFEPPPRGASSLTTTTTTTTTTLEGHMFVEGAGPLGFSSSASIPCEDGAWPRVYARIAHGCLLAYRSSTGTRCLRAVPLGAVRAVRLGGYDEAGVFQEVNAADEENPWWGADTIGAPQCLAVFSDALGCDPVMIALSTHEEALEWARVIAVAAAAAAAASEGEERAGESATNRIHPRGGDAVGDPPHDAACTGPRDGGVVSDDDAVRPRRRHAASAPGGVDAEALEDEDDRLGVYDAFVRGELGRAATAVAQANGEVDSLLVRVDHLEARASALQARLVAERLAHEDERASWWAAVANDSTEARMDDAAREVQLEGQLAEARSALMAACKERDDARRRSDALERELVTRRSEAVEPGNNIARSVPVHSSSQRVPAVFVAATPPPPAVFPCMPVVYQCAHAATTWEDAGRRGSDASRERTARSGGGRRVVP